VKLGPWRLGQLAQHRDLGAKHPMSTPQRGQYFAPCEDKERLVFGEVGGPHCIDEDCSVERPAGPIPLGVVLHSCPPARTPAGGAGTGCGDENSPAAARRSKSAAASGVTYSRPQMLTVRSQPRLRQRHAVTADTPLMRTHFLREMLPSPSV